MRINEINSFDRPRERLKQNGVESLSNAELLAIIIQKGTRGLNAIELSNNIINNFTLSNLIHCSTGELQKIKGVGFAKACQIKSIFELHKRCSLLSNQNKVIKNPKDVYDYCHPIIGNKEKEHFMILLLDTRNRVIKHEIVSIGTINSSIIHPREIFRSAIKENCNSIILVHNHPSGDPTPSNEDKKITKIIEEAGELLSIKVLDHIILGEDIFSFKEISS